MKRENYIKLLFDLPKQHVTFQKKEMKHSLSIVYSLLFILLWNFALPSHASPSEGEGIYIKIPEYENSLPDQISHRDREYTNMPYMLSSSFGSYEERLVPKEANEAAQEAAGGFQMIEEAGSWIETLSTEDLVELPIGLMHSKGNESSSSGDNVEYAIGVMSARFKPEYSELTVFARIRIPQSDGNGKKRELFFGADNIKLSHKGGIIGDAKLVLLGDIEIPFNGGEWQLILKGGFDYTSGEVASKTFVTMDCDGVKELSIEGEVLFSKKMIVPVKPDYSPDFEKQVKGRFSIQAEGWNDLLAEVDLDPFMLAKQAEKYNQQGAFVFTLNTAILDFSDFQNASKVKFPPYYYEHQLLGPNEKTWRGVYIETLEVALPKVFKKEGQGNKPISFGAYHMIIDNYGVSGTFKGENIFPLKEGRTDSKASWAYSLDHISISLAASKFQGAQLGGQIVLPISSDETTLSYMGIISEEEYMLRIGADDTLNFNIWKASANLLPNSSIEMKVVESSFKPKACLHGSINFGKKKKTNDGSDKAQGATADKKDDKLSGEGLVFQNLVLQTEKPVFQVDYFGYEGELKLGNFPLSISNIGLTTNSQEANLAFTVSVAFMGKEDKGFGAAGSFNLLGAYEESSGRQKWKYNKLKINGFSIDVDLGSCAFKGELQLRDDDPVYGDGFYAQLEATFGGTLTLNAEAMFGKTDFHYWYVAASVEGLNIQAGPITFQGFSGGASYRMLPKIGTNVLSKTSGLSYEPNNDVRLGIKAGVLAGIIRPEAISVKVGFEVLTTSSGGIARIGFFGEAVICDVISLIDPTGEMNQIVGGMQSKLSSITDKVSEGVVDKLSGLSSKIMNQSMQEKSEVLAQNPAVAPSGGAITAYMGIEHDFINKTLHGEMKVFINVVGIFTGVGEGGRAGWAVFHAGPDATYLHIGTPTDPCGVKAGVGSAFIQMTNYFMIGDKIPGSPPPPPAVARILGISSESLDYMRDENALGEGKGFAFGAHFEMNTGDMSFLILYANFQAGLGFDIMLKDYGEAQCVNNGMDQIGINGWYANGQAYAYLEGELGIKIKLFFIKKKIPIIRGGAATLLQAKGPNPFWMQGYLGGYYSLLGGMIEGKFRFKFELGEQCEFADASLLGGMKIITNVVPNDGDEEVDVFAVPQASFSMKIGEAIIIPEEKEDRVYKIIMEQCELIQEDGKKVEGTISWNRSKDVVSFMPQDILEPNKHFTFKLEVSFQEQINGVFRTILVDGVKAIETEERSFSSGSAPDYIPLQNVRYAYPVITQQNFFTKEYDKGYIVLKQGQDYLFDDGQWESQLWFTAEGKKPLEVRFVYDAIGNRIDFPLPSFEKETSYQMAIISLPVQDENRDLEEAVVSQTEALGEGNTMDIKSKAIALQSNLDRGGIERLTYDFRTSKYSTFEKKIKSLKIRKHGWTKYYSDVIALYATLHNNEAFGKIELVGSEHTEKIPLIDIKASLNDPYYTEDIAPAIYSKYPIENQFYVSRDDAVRNPYAEPDFIGIPPAKALILSSSYITCLEQNIRKEMLETSFPFMYNLPLQYKKDWIELRTQIANHYVGEQSQAGKRIGPDALRILHDSYSFIREGDYEVEMQYILPGGISGTAAKFKFRNPLKFRPE